MRAIYMDCNASTPVDPLVLHEMLPFFTHEFGNASSADHAFGWRAEDAVSVARARVAALLRARSDEILFTSGATESDNLAIRGVVEAAAQDRRRVVTVATEHKAVLETCNYLSRTGVPVTVLPVDASGLVDLERLKAAITPDTALVSVMAANNEIGTLQPVAEIGAMCREAGVLFHSDAVQAAGRIPLDVEAMNVDLLSLSAHKMYGPKGVGALFVRRTARRNVAPQMHGGGHEGRLRAGTANVPGAVGMGMACELAVARMHEDPPHIEALARDLLERIRSALDRVTLNGHPTKRLPGNVSLSFAGVKSEALILSLDGVAVSAGSACTSSQHATSHVLKALGLPDDLVRSVVRFGICRNTTPEDVAEVADRVAAAVCRLRDMAPLGRE